MIRRLRVNDEVDRKGHRVVVGRNSAYDLYLTRNLKQAEIVRTPTSATVVDTFMKENLRGRRRREAAARERRAPRARACACCRGASW